MLDGCGSEHCNTPTVEIWHIKKADLDKFLDAEDVDLHKQKDAILKKAEYKYSISASLIIPE